MAKTKISRNMRLVRSSFDSPEEAIALDELLLAKAESGQMGETLRFWSVREYFVVMGRAGKVTEDCFLDRCRREGIRIIRRISGGGAVLQGPGCLNYSAVLSYERDEKYRDIRYSYCRILGDISSAFRSRGYNVEFFPISDLALNRRKISGNAQARRRKFFLHHGTFLYDFDLAKTSLYLRHPSKEPEYRQSRDHRDFLTNVPIEPSELEALIKGVFSCPDGVWEPSGKDIECLRGIVSRRYQNREWNYAF